MQLYDDIIKAQLRYIDRHGCVSFRELEDELIRQGYARRDGHTLKLTRAGKLRLNELSA